MNVTLLSKKDRIEKNDIEYTHDFNLIFKNSRVGNSTEMEYAKPQQGLTLDDGIIIDSIFFYLFSLWFFSPN